MLVISGKGSYSENTFWKWVLAYIAPDIEMALDSGHQDASEHDLPYDKQPVTFRKTCHLWLQVSTSPPIPCPWHLLDGKWMLATR